jgi:hypothetical protein
MENHQFEEAPATQSVGVEAEFDRSQPYPDLYADSISMALGPFGLALMFGVTDVENPARRRVVATVRISPQLAFTTVQMLRKSLKEARDQGLGLTPTRAIMESMKLDEEL